MTKMGRTFILVIIHYTQIFMGGGGIIIKTFTFNMVIGSIQIAQNEITLYINGHGYDFLVKSILQSKLDP